MSILVMGVSGSGKSTFGAALAHRIEWNFIDADDLHPQRNIEKMTAGSPLDDVDRSPWLDAVGAVLARGHVVVACSALKRRYRDRLRAAAPAVDLVHLHGDATTLTQRMAARSHFMRPSMLASQLAALERPDVDEQALELDTAAPIEDLLDVALARLLITDRSESPRVHLPPTSTRTP